MTSAALLQRAADLVIEFGLTDADATAEQVRDSADRGDGLLVVWRAPCAAIELSIRRRTDGLEAFVTPALGRMRVADAKRAHLLHGRIIDLAARIEALR